MGTFNKGDLLEEKSTGDEYFVSGISIGLGNRPNEYELTDRRTFTIKYQIGNTYYFSYTEICQLFNLCLYHIGDKVIYNKETYYIADDVFEGDNWSKIHPINDPLNEFTVLTSSLSSEQKPVNQNTSGCNHVWKKYHGFSTKTVWENCEKCGVKREDTVDIPNYSHTLFDPPF